MIQFQFQFIFSLLAEMNDRKREDADARVD